MQYIAVILAAGKGSRMFNSTPKVLLKIAKKPMLEYILITLKSLNIPSCIVINSDMENHKTFKNLQAEYNFSYVIQQQKLGTADALSQALPKCKDYKNILVLYGDVPLISSESIKSLLELHQSKNSYATCLGFEASNPFGYGRVYTKNNMVDKILEENQLDITQKSYNLCNSGTMIVKNHNLPQILAEIAKLPNKEHYLTEIYNILTKNAKECYYNIAPEKEVTGANTPEQLDTLEQYIQQKIVERHRQQGARIIYPHTSYFAYNSIVEADVTIYPNVYIGNNVHIGKGSIIHSFSWLEGTRIGENNEIGPFVRMRPGSETDEKVKIGNFVETKDAKIATETKASHLAYLGDIKIGKNVNIGAGTISCNYDGYRKHSTVIEDDVLVGSNCSLIAPITLGKNSVIGAGSVVTKSCEEDDLVIARAPQKNLPQQGKIWRKKQLISNINAKKKTI